MKNRFLLASVAVLMMLCLATPAWAQSEIRVKRGWKKAWIASALALAAATAFDARSSTGRFETNPLLRRPDGTFSPRRALVIKGTTAGVMLFMQSLHGRKHPEIYKAATIVNAATAGIFTATAARNLSVPKAPDAAR